MSTLASAGNRFHPGTQIHPAGAIHTTPLGYDRIDLPVGTPLPIPASTELVDPLNTCGEMEVAFAGKLGDTLLALSAVRGASPHGSAAHEAAGLGRRSRWFTCRGPARSPHRPLPVDRCTAHAGIAGSGGVRAPGRRSAAVSRGVSRSRPASPA